MILPIDIIYDILFKYVSNFDTFTINKKLYNNHNAVITKASIIINKLLRSKNVKYNIGYIEYLPTDIYKRVYIRTYPKIHIINNIKLAIIKLKKISSDITIEQLKNILIVYYNSNKNTNYLLNKFVRILSKDELEYVGW